MQLGLASNRDDGLAAGEPVMMQVNDYGRGIFNGDQGLILHVADRDRPEPMAVFRRGRWIRGISHRFAAAGFDYTRMP